MDQNASTSEQNLRSFFTAGPSRPSPSRPHPPPVYITNLMASDPDHYSSRAILNHASFLPHLTSTSTRRMIPRNELEISRPTLARAEKDGDDPTASSTRRRAPDRTQSSTPTTISRLFASPNSPPDSRMPSFVRPVRTGPREGPGSDINSLPSHLYVRGLLDGRYSDIKVTVLGESYALHRIVLDQAPFFASALSEPWLESTAKEVTLHPEEIDSNITSISFELALKRLYGCPDTEQEARFALSAFATGCWLEMKDLIDASTEALLQKMRPKSLPIIIDTVTVNYYGKGGTRILEACKSLLSRDGLQMPIRYWDEIPSEVIRDVIRGDNFFVPNEWDRYLFARRLLDRRLKALADQSGMLTPGVRSVAPPDFRYEAPRRVVSSDNTTGLTSVPHDHTAWIALYEHLEILPMFELLDHGIHYMHLDFEQLQCIRSARDIFGVPVVPEKVINDALWTGLELRQKIVNAKEEDEGLGLTQIAASTMPRSPGDVHSEYHNQTASHITPEEKNQCNQDAPGLNTEDKTDKRVEDPDPTAAKINAVSKFNQRRFWIPSVDCNIVTGGAEPIITLSSTVSDRQWPMKPRPGRISDEHRPSSYTLYPPYRFAVEFPNPRFLKDEKRTYSKTIFYAGSLWNLYVQKKRSGSKRVQLGVYLHRAKERGPENDFHPGSVDERIGALERDLLSRSDHRVRHRRGMHDGDLHDEDDFSSGGDGDLTSTSRHFPTFVTTGAKKQSSKIKSDTPMENLSPVFGLGSEDSSSEGSSDEDFNTEGPSQTIPFFRKSAVPPYYDNRHTIKTYFKIYSPSKGGRLLSVYESAPDCFNFSQSWGWKSNSLMLEDDWCGDEVEIPPVNVPPEEETREFVDALDEGILSREPRKVYNGKLRFMVVLGVV